MTASDDANACCSALLSALASVLGDTQKRLDAVERTLPDCEVLLHTL
jgi:hypothetical protein